MEDAQDHKRDMFSGYANIPVIVDLAARHRLPAMYDTREYVNAGGLMTYAADLQEIWRRGGGYIDRILKGHRLADLPVERPAKVDLVINLRAAKPLGRTIPRSVLERRTR